MRSIAMAFLRSILICLATWGILFTTACMPEIKVEALPIGILEESYTYTFGVDDNDWDWGNWWDNESMLLGVVQGELPDGIGLSSNGELFGTPTEVGNFQFKVGAYEVSGGNIWDSNSDDVDYDSEWFTLFVTEKSTNESCPNPGSSSVNDIYLCAGIIEEETIEEGDELILDINFFVNYDDGISYDITVIDFTITYDAAAFAIGDDATSGDFLREAATRQDATVDIDTSVAGQIRIILEAQTDQFHAGGRMIDLPLTALGNLAQGDYNFTITTNAITSNSDATLPDISIVNGTVSVTEGFDSEETATDTATATETDTATE